MYCKKCGAKIEENANFCPYCGDKTGSNTSSNSNNSNEIKYLDDYPKNKIEYADDRNNEITDGKKDYKCLIGLVVAILSIFLTFVHFALGLAGAIIGLVLIIIGFKKTNKSLRITSLILAIISLIIVIFVSTFMVVSSFEITLDDGYTTTIKDYFIDVVEGTLKADKVKGYWVDEDNELLYLSPNGNYYLYLDKDNLESNYIKGTYSYDSGYTFNYDDIYSNDDYYYYSLHFSWEVEKNGEVEDLDNIEKLFREDILLKIDKKKFNKLILNFPELDTEIDFNRYSK